MSLQLLFSTISITRKTNRTAVLVFCGFFLLLKLITWCTHSGAQATDERIRRRYWFVGIWRTLTLPCFSLRFLGSTEIPTVSSIQKNLEVVKLILMDNYSSKLCISGDFVTAINQKTFKKFSWGIHQVIFFLVSKGLLGNGFFLALQCSSVQWSLFYSNRYMCFARISAELYSWGFKFLCRFVCIVRKEYFFQLRDFSKQADLTFTGTTAAYLEIEP